MLFDDADDVEPVPSGLQPWQRLKVNLVSRADRDALALLVGQPLDRRYVWFPTPTLEQAARLPAVEPGGGWRVSPLLAQADVLEEDAEWKTAWQGMPAYESLDVRPADTVFIYFQTMADRAAFGVRTDVVVSDLARSVWYPDRKRHVTTHEWRGTDRTSPRYPVYIISKGRWESRLTSKHFEKMGIPYQIVVEPQERGAYAAVIDPVKVLTLPFSNLGLGSIPARNWVWDHATATGAERHWIVDDNINGFYRLHENLKVPISDGTFLRVMEDFADRYENVAMAGPYYDFFAPRRMVFPPFLLNTRVYSMTLLTNKTEMRWRGRYNEDTDLSLRFMTEGYALVSFYAFLQKKSATMTVKGGNLTELYQGDGRRLMAESLQQQHPDCVTVTEKWGRAQHLVDYRRFRPKSQGGVGLNELRLKPGLVIPDGVDDYGLHLVPVDPRPPSASSASRSARTPSTTAPVVAGPSIWDFLGPVPATSTVKELTPLLAAGSSPQTASSGKPLGARAESFLANPGRPADVPRAPAETPIEPPGGPEALKADLARRGHRFLTRDGKFFISESSKLTAEDREQIKTHRAALIMLAEPWTDTPGVAMQSEALIAKIPIEVGASIPSPVPSSPFDEPRNTQTLAQFLGIEPPRADTSFVPDEPPDLTGIDEVVLNFATNGLDWAQGDRPVGMTVSTLDGKLCRFLPFAFRYGGNLDEGVVKRWAQEQLRSKKVTNARTKFDLHHARVWGIDLEEQGCTFSDVQHTAALLDDHRKRFGLDVLAADYFPGEQFAPRVDETRHHDHHASEVAAREKVTAQLVGRLRAAMYPELEKQGLMDVQRLEDDVIPAVVEMEKNGSSVDMELLERYGRECSNAHDALMLEISEEAGFAFEHTANGWKRLLESLHLTPPDSFSEKVLNEVDHPLVRKGQRAAQYASLNSKIFKSYPEHTTDGVLRYSINQLASDDGGTVSGRFSIGLVQQVPNRDNHSAAFGDDLFPRRLFVPGVGDYLEADAAQIEFRLLVHYSQNAKLLQAYKDDPWMSFHKKTWEMMKAYKPDMLYAHQKNFNFASQYGARSIRLAVMMEFITEGEGEEIRRAKRWDDPRLKTIKEIEAAYKQAHPEAGELLEYASHLAKPECDKYCKTSDALHRQYSHQGYVKTLLGRRSRFRTHDKHYIGLNRVLQGTGADIMKRKIVELHKVRKETGFVMRITNHDAVLGDATTPGTLGKVSAVLNAQSFPLKVPILWKCGVGKDWASCNEE